MSNPGPAGHDEEKLIKIAVISDTHAGHVENLAPDLMDAMLKADLIIHLGDFASHDLLQEVRALRQTYGVAGNHDDAALHEELPNMQVVEVGGKRLGLIHGLTFPFGSHRRLMSWFKNHRVDAILYGHTHRALSRKIGSVYLFNPGTATGKYPAYRSSIGLLTIDGSINGEIVRLEYRGEKPTLVNRFRGAFICWAVSIIETWPYVDVLGFMGKVKRCVVRLYQRAIRVSRPADRAGTAFRD